MQDHKEGTECHSEAIWNEFSPLVLGNETRALHIQAAVLQLRYPGSP